MVMNHHFARTNSETKIITHDLAVAFSTMTASVGERLLDPHRVQYLKDKVLAGDALPFNWARVTTKDTNETARVNGLHSSTALASLNGDLPDGLIAYIDDYEVATSKDVPVLFKQFDSRRSVRSLADISGCYQMVTPELRNVPRESAQKAIGGIAWFERVVVGKPTPPGEEVFTLYYVPAYHPFIQMVGRIYSKKTPEFKPGPVLGAMFGTFECDRAQSEQFWSDVSHEGAGHQEGHPTKTLDAWLLSVGKLKDEPKQMEIFRACALAWNAFRNNRTLDKIGKWDPKKGFPELE
jgi:hypothetical protein